MKKNILIIVLALILTGCTAEYTLTIDKGVYNEEVNITGESNDEISSFSKNWMIAVDKDTYSLQGDPDTTAAPDNTYDYKISGNNLTFSHDFNVSSINESSAISNCYDVIRITPYDGDIIISTDKNVKCFEKYPTLNSLKINIVTDKEVLSNNADSVDGNKYIWNLNRNDSNKAINMTMKNDNTSSEPSINNKSDGKRDYSLYIFCGILLICFFIGYLIFNKIKKDGNRTNV